MPHRRRDASLVPDGEGRRVGQPVRDLYSRRNALRTIGASVALLAGCVSTPAAAQEPMAPVGIPRGAAPGTPGEPGLDLPVTYEGTARVEYQATPGSGTSLEPRTTTLPAQVYLDEPYSFGGLTESNPMHLVVNVGPQTDEPSPVVDAGQLFLVSALGTYTPYTGREVLLQYWTFDYDDGTGALSGELVDTHTAVSAAINTLWIEDTRFGLGTTVAFVYAGTTMQGTITGTSAEVTVRGTAFDLLSAQVSFSAAIQVQRVP